MRRHWGRGGNVDLPGCGIQMVGQRLIPCDPRFFGHPLPRACWFDTS
ncbi:hypothetical protein roselon_01047 [Roseibacterium elongatum DSM 19469]|uniref:Uncharacterized protein n=1 Tax=Roseicyclus elongatus DSM 19469 TaxID=1294273 RepID=W8RQN0_9RHOB|nr:hypothetical protein roselon_01047 [Roseibacterium elongatum DSM 19469]